MPPFPLADGDLEPREVEVLDPQPKGLQQPEARAVEERRDELVLPAQLAEDRPDLLLREDDRKPAASARPDDVEFAQLLAEDVTVEEQQRRESLGLGRGGDVPIGGKVGEERVDLGLGQVPRMALAVEEDEAPDPAGVGLFGAPGEMAGADLSRRWSRSLGVDVIGCGRSGFPGTGAVRAAEGNGNTGTESLRPR